MSVGITMVEPQDGATGVDRKTLITLDVFCGNGEHLNTASIQVSLAGVPAVVDTQFQAGFDGPDSAVSDIENGVRVVIDPVDDFSPGTTVIVDANAFILPES